MDLNKVTTFGPGQEFRLDKRVIFVEYESMTGELVKCRFDLSQKTEMIYNDYRILSFDDLTYLYSTDEEILIKKVLYYEKECHAVVGDKLLIPTKVYFENAGYQQMSARYIHMQRSRCSGKTLWLSSAAAWADPLHDLREEYLKAIGHEEDEKLSSWLKIPEYLDTDTVQYCLNDVAVTEKIFKEEKIMRFDSCKPTIKKVIFNDPATIVFWTDGTKTIVKCGENDDFDPEKGIAMACMKKLLGTNKTGSNYLDKAKKYISKWEEDNPVENIWTKLFCELGKMTGEDLVNTDVMDIPEETENSETTEGGENNDEA